MQTFSIMAAPAPQLLRDYLIYMSTIKGRSPRTVEASLQRSPPIPAVI